MAEGANLSRRGVLTGIGSLLGAGCVEVEATPAHRPSDWRLYGRDPGRTRFVPTSTLPRDGVDIAWERSTGAGGWRPPVLANGAVYCQYSNGLFVLDPATGEGQRVGTNGGFGRGGAMAIGSTDHYRDGVLLVPYGETIVGYAVDPDDWPASVQGFGENRARWWAVGDDIGTGVDLGSGILRPLPHGRDWLTSPVIVDGRVVSLHTISRTISSADTDSGGRHWCSDLQELDLRQANSLEPLGQVVDTTSETVVVSAHTFHGPLFIGFDLEDGTLEWTQEYERHSDVEDSRSTVRQDNLVATDGTVYATTWTDREQMLEISEFDAATGAVGWTRSVARTGHSGFAVDASLLYHAGRIEAEGVDQTTVVAIDRDSGDVQWTRSLYSSGSSWEPGLPPTITGNLLLVPGGGGLNALDRDTGELLWTFAETVPTSGGSDSLRTPVTPAIVSDDRIVLSMTLALYGLE